jgi:hypothetical protein
MVEKHGTSRRRSWRKLPIGIEAESGEIIAIELTRKDIGDTARTGAMLDQITGLLASFTADDQVRVYEATVGRDPDAAVIGSPRSTTAVFAARVQFGRLPGQPAYQLPAQTDYSLGGTLLHWRSAPLGRTKIPGLGDTASTAISLQ